MTPSRASTETVNAVPNGVSFWSVIWRSPSSSQRSSVRQRQTRPRACVTMKLTASGVANWAAIVRSPSFSRSSSSTTTTKRPSRISSIASSTVAKGLSVLRLGCHRHGRIVPGRSFSTYLASTSVSRLTSSPAVELAERRDLERVRDQRHLEARLVDRSDGERDAVDGDRSLLDAVAEQLGRRLDPDANAVRCRLDRGNRSGAVDVALHLVASERIARPERRLDVDAVAKRLDARQRLGHDVERERPGRRLDDRQADTVDRDRVADLGRSRRTRRRASRPRRTRPFPPPARAR